MIKWSRSSSVSDSESRFISEEKGASEKGDGEHAKALAL
jgi:hypothetical protein